MNGAAATEWQRAKQALESAGHLLPKDPEGAASRAFYAAFHAMTAYFALGSRAFSKHTALRAAIHRDLVRTGVCPPETGKAYDMLTDIRQRADYSSPVRVSHDAAERALSAARQVLDFVRQSCPEFGHTET